MDSIFLHDSPYQLQVVNEVLDGDFEAIYFGKRYKTVTFFKTVRRAMQFENVIVGDIRSGFLLLSAIYLRLIARKRIVSSDDGLATLNLDLHGVTFRTMSDGSVRPLKRVVLCALSSWVAELPRISLYPKFVERCGKKNWVVNSSPTFLRPNFTSDRVLIIGQNYDLLGIGEKDQRSMIREIEDRFPGYEVCYSQHPRQATLGPFSKCTRVGAINTMDKNRYRVVATITSTAAIPFGLSGSELYFFSPVKTKGDRGPEAISIDMCQRTIREVIKCELSSPL